MPTVTPTPPAGKGAKLEAQFARHKKPILGVAAAVVLFLAWRARKSGATSTTSGTGATLSTTSAPVGGGGATPAYYTAGSGAYDSTATDVYNALQPQIEYLQQLAQSIPVSDPYADTGATTSAPIDKGRALSAADVMVRDGSLGSAGQIYRVEADGTATPITSSTWSAFRNTTAGSGYAVQGDDPGAFANVLRAATNAAV